MLCFCAQVYNNVTYYLGITCKPGLSSHPDKEDGAAGDSENDLVPDVESAKVKCQHG